MALTLGWAAPLGGQARLDLRPIAMGLLAPAPFVGAGVSVVSWGRFRVGGGGAVASGVRSGRPAVRAEAWAGYHLDPVRLRGWAPYAGAGGAVVAGGGDAAGYIMVLVGLERRPGGGRGWFAEAGLGGGPRVALGYRFSRR
ncbi:MAG TPA: hypothetical protein VD793_03750, partial [Gemmatimonadales bacterium]|nr:hypothetical protein [Gemmatimonadales bacterium]